MTLTTFYVISKGFTCFNLWPKHNSLVDPRQTVGSLHVWIFDTFWSRPDLCQPEKLCFLPSSSFWFLSSRWMLSRLLLLPPYWLSRSPYVPLRRLRFWTLILRSWYVCRLKLGCRCSRIFHALCKRSDARRRHFHHIRWVTRFILPHLRFWCLLTSLAYCFWSGGPLHPYFSSR